jgi:5-methylcytosine-specific restriction protein A
LKPSAADGRRSSSQRSPEAAAYRWLYRTPRWAAAREAQLCREPLCEECSKAGLTTPATVVNHRIPHKGDETLFWDPSNHQSVCKPHHDGPIQKAEGLGFSPAVDAGGWPSDPKHPSNRSR